MALREHFENSGAWLFRWRSYLPLLLYVPLFLAVKNFRYPNDSHYAETIWELICFALGVAGLVLRAYTVGYAAPATSGRVTGAQEAAALNTRGIYSVVRHPLYLGNYLMWLAVMLLTRNSWLVLVISLVFWLYYERIMFAEEAFLRRRFGAVYDEWANRVPAFIPALRGWKPPEHGFEFRRVLRRERSGLLGLIATFFAFATYVDWKVQGELHVDWLWAALLVFALLFYALLEVDKRRLRRK